MSTPTIGLRGAVWRGPGHDLLPDHVVVVADGVVTAIAPYGDAAAADAEEIVGDGRSWIGPGLYDRHVHLAFGAPADLVAGGVLRARDLGAPGSLELGSRGGGDGLEVLAAGRLLTAPDGYPSRSWGADGFASFAASPEEATAHCHAEHRRGAGLIKVALEDAGGQPTLAPEVLAAAVRTAHGLGLPVVAHALTVEMVLRALDAGVDELAHTPTEPLPVEVVARLREQRVSVCSTLQTFFAEGRGASVATNAAALIAAEVPVHYATDLGNTGTRPGADPRELDRLALAGLGRGGALAAAAAGTVDVGGPARLVLLPEDPLAEPTAWWTPSAVLAGDRLHRGAVGDA
ncbi:amidohydrolase family protein [Cumulibacter manganitolerans]|uniref:hypothetical protein n=1 Tax=Cumulibacter manganitolerans TaxID=1884992 RepID=UPI001296E3CB|nr:hypothetical protein [Cumulibacter manganitolerans]